MIASWWAGLSLAMKILWGITISSSLIFVIQTVLTFVGAGGDVDMDTPSDFSTDGFDGDAGMNLYTFRNFVNFFLGFGWTAVLLHDKISATWLLLTIAALVGVILVTIVMYVFKWLSTMQASGNIDLEATAVGCRGSVYLTIPAERKGEGKVQISINNSVREYNAVTDGDAIKTGTQVKVVEVIDSNTLLVEEQSSLIV